MPFEIPDDVVVKQVDEENWELRSLLAYRGKVDRWEVPVGSGTDFASVPRAFVWFLPRYGLYTRAAILHDFLWRTRAAAGEMSWIDADAVFRRAMRELGVPFLRRWIMWAAVRWAALTKPGGLRGWWREAWRVVLVTLVAAPFVVPPGLLILLSLVLFWVLEAILWIPLKIAERVRPRAKEVVAPSLDLTTS
jgi:hypothetical protein